MDHSLKMKMGVNRLNNSAYCKNNGGNISTGGKYQFP